MFSRRDLGGWYNTYGYTALEVGDQGYQRCCIDVDEIPRGAVGPTRGPALYEEKNRGQPVELPVTDDKSFKVEAEVVHHRTSKKRSPPLLAVFESADFTRRNPDRLLRLYSHNVQIFGGGLALPECTL